MKHLPAWLLSLLLWSPAWGQPAPLPSVDELCKIVETERHRHPGEAIRQGLDFQKNFDLHYHRLVWQIDPARRYITGAVTSHFRSTEPEVQQIFFELSRTLTVDSVHHRGRRIPFIHNANEYLGLYFPQPLTQGQLDSVTIWYQGPPRDSIRAFVQSEHAGQPVVWTLSQPYGAREWWPSKQTLDDKIDSLDVLITVPRGNRAVSNGLLVNTIDQDSLLTYHWRHRHPIPAYLIAVAVTNYALHEVHWVSPAGDSLPIPNYIYPEDSAGYADDVQQLLPMIGVFDSLFGAYPFRDEHYGHAQFGWPGGMEHQTMSFLFNWDFYLLAHELAHQWFGDYVTCGSWSDIWLNEGFATYLTGLTYENLLRPQFWADFRRVNRDLITAEPGGSVYVYGADTLDVSRTFDGRLTYRKGAFVLHMLRWVLGDSTLWAGLQLYLQEQAAAGGYARTADLQRHLKAVSGKDLSEFFDDWVYGAGHPRYVVEASQTADSLFIQVFQAPSDTSVDFFEMPLPILLERPGADTLLRLDHTFNGQTFALPLTQPVLHVRWDPDIWLLAELSTLTYAPPRALAISLTLAPIPVQDWLTLRWDATQWQPTQAILLDAMGRRLRTWPLARQGQARLNLHHLPSGAYLLRFDAPSGPVLRKVWKAP